MLIPFLTAKFVEHGRVFRRIVSSDFSDEMYVDKESGGLFLYNDKDEVSPTYAKLLRGGSFHN